MAPRLCECGCGEPVNPRRGYPTKPAARFVQNHQYRNRVSYLVDPETGCWVWQRDVNTLGYGRVYDPKTKRVSLYAHRVYYEKHRGPIPDGHVIDHLCRNTSCVNPGHLEAVLQKENVRRGKRVKLTLEVVREIRAATGYGAVKRLAEEHGISIHTAYNARKKDKPTAHFSWRDA